MLLSLNFLLSWSQICDLHATIYIWYNDNLFSFIDLHLFNRKAALYCTLCKKELRHKYRAPDEWKISGFLCGDCHIAKTKEFILKKEQERMRTEQTATGCGICQKPLVEQSDKKKPRWQWNMESGIMLCQTCYDKKEAGYVKKLNFCSVCDKKMGFIRYNPKPVWNIDGQICRQCWDEQNKTRR